MKLSLGLLAVVLCLSGCNAVGELRESTVESSNRQLGAARRSGFETEILVSETAMNAKALLGGRAERDEGTTLLVLTRNDAQVVWGGELRADPPTTERALIGRWVAPYLRLGDQDTALKAFVFGYLDALHRESRIEWDAAIVPFLPPTPLPPRSYVWGFWVSFATMLLVLWSSRRIR
jgi:hypothetical protein